MIATLPSPTVETVSDRDDMRDDVESIHDRNLDDAIRCFSRAVERAQFELNNTLKAEAHFHLTVVYHKFWRETGRTDREILRQAQLFGKETQRLYGEIDDENCDEQQQHDLGRILYEAGEYDNAYDAVDRAIKLNDRNGNADRQQENLRLMSRIIVATL